MVNPTKKFIIAIDGTSGLGKQQQQRQRRYKSSKERRDKKEDNQEVFFDSNKITTGSEFMHNLSRYLFNFIKNKMTTDEEWKKLEVVFSNEKVYGEGEHKIIEFMKGDNLSYCIHSPDADLIMLTLPVDKEIYILRENIYSSINCKYFLVDVDIFKKKLITILSWNNESEKFTSKQAIYDFVLMCFLLGNDFLPHIPSLEISSGAIELLLEVYPIVCSSKGHFVYRNSDNELCINKDSISQFFFSLSQRENSLLIQVSKEKKMFPDKLLMKHISFKNDECILNFKKYRVEYYIEKVKEDDVYNTCMEYYKGLLFIIRYYIDGIPDWYWYYPYNFSPFLVDLASYIDDFDNEMKFNLHSPLTPFEQLLAVIPPDSKNILPPSIRVLYEKDSPIIDFFPDDFEIDLDGKKQEWEGRPILPVIDVHRLIEAYKTVKNTLTDEEKKRNYRGKNILYNFRGDLITTLF